MTKEFLWMLLDDMIEQILELMTPQEILELTEFERPTPIYPGDFRCFDDLLCRRGAIKNLTLLPVKSNEMRDLYQSTPKAQLEEEVRANLRDHEFVCCSNKFPYMLPSATVQKIIWVRDKNASRESIAKFIADTIKALNESNDDLSVSPDSIILFERPIGIDAKLIRGTFAQVRHIHFWYRG